MKPNIATNSCHRQQLIRAGNKDKLQPMVANSKEDFANRLNTACSNAKPPIAEGHGRRAELRRRVMSAGLNKVSGEAVRKWLSGETIPSMDNIRFIALALNVNAEWLLTGRDSQDNYQYPADNAAPAQARISENVVFRHFNPAIAEVVEIMELLDEPEQRDIVGLARAISTQSRLNRNSKQRAGQ